MTKHIVQTCVPFRSGRQQKFWYMQGYTIRTEMNLTRTHENKPKKYTTKFLVEKIFLKQSNKIFSDSGYTSELADEKTTKLIIKYQHKNCANEVELFEMQDLFKRCNTSTIGSSCRVRCFPFHSAHEQYEFQRYSENIQDYPDL